MFIGSYKTNSAALRPLPHVTADVRGAASYPHDLGGSVTLASFNAAPEQEAVAAMLACCASRRFAAAMTDGRPYPSLAAAERAAETAFAALAWDDVREAMDAHPRIGARVSGQSATEQSGVGDDSRAALAAGNAAYQERF